MAVFNNTHRAFLQSCIATQLVSEQDIFELYRRVCEATQATYNESQLPDFIAEVNRGIDKYDLEFRKAANEDTGVIYWALVNTNGDKIAQYATGYSSQELQYFKRILDKIIKPDDEVFAVSSIHALNDAPATMTRVNTEALLNRFIADGWLSHSSNGYYALGIRCLLELQTSLKDEYMILKECTLCMDIISKGERCDDERCDARLHYHCAQRYFRPDVPHKCLICQKPWTHTTHVGPRAAESIKNRTFTIHQYNSPNMQSSRPETIETEVEEEVEEMEEMEEEVEEVEEEVVYVKSERSAKRHRH